MSNRPKSRRPAGNRSHVDEQSGLAGNPLLKWLIVGVVAVVVVGVIIVFATSDAEQQAETEAAQVADVGLVGERLPPFGSSAGDPAVGFLAPGFSATGFDGVEVSVSPGDGRAKVIGFFAHWCPHCQAELPRLSNWLSNNAVPAGVDVIAVSTSVDKNRGNWPPSAWFEEEGWTATVVRDSSESEIAQFYGLNGFPYTVVVGGNGAVLERVSGELSGTRWESMLAAAAATVS